MARVSDSGGYIYLDDVGVRFDEDGYVRITSNDPEFDGDGSKGMIIAVRPSPALRRLWNNLGQPTPAKARARKAAIARGAS
jgi:hypothetical protein